MIVYQATKSQFLVDASNGIEDIISKNISEILHLNIRQGSSEYNAWKNSLGNAMFHVINTDEIPGDASIAIEYGIPRTKNRIDFIICGRDENHDNNIVIIELKQWDAVNKINKDGIVSTRFAHGEVETTHPSYQAWSYSSLLQNFNEVIYQEKIKLKPCAYLHNLKELREISDPYYNEYLALAPVFINHQKNQLRQFISKHIRFGDNSKLINRVDSGNVRPSKDLADSISSMISGNKEFVLIDDQKIVFENALSLIKSENKQKQVMIVKGGPGTGKSVVAINLLAESLKLRQNSCYVTKNSAPRTVFKTKLTKNKKNDISALFLSSGAFTTSITDSMDTIIVDEAHRLNAKSGIYQNLGENQIKEIINAAKVSIFFVDEDQIVTWKDIGKIAEIEKWAHEFNATITYGMLQSQFRCNGSDGYLAWLDNTIQIRETANKTLEEINYDFQVFSDPNELFEKIIEKNAVNNKSRVLAGYCWDWRSKKDKAFNDVFIEDKQFAKQWNLTSDGGAYVISPHSVNQIGCIHTAQGLDLEYVGVIIGPDLIIRNGKVITNPKKRAKSDQSLKGYSKDLKNRIAGTETKADIIIKNTYKTLMSRGLKGCYLYCTDLETSNYFRERAKKYNK